jgi:hypothetical protein
MVHCTAYSAEVTLATKAGRCKVPEDIFSLPLVADQIDLGVTAVSNAGNESEISKIIVSIDFAVPGAPMDLRLEDF